MLAEFGAEVLRVEPSEGDFIRKCTPYGILYRGEGLNYLSEGRNKFHITLNLEKPEAREMLKGLAAQADVLIETYRPGVMDDWGLGYEALKEINPRLIFASITTHGQFGLCAITGCRITTTSSRPDRQTSMTRAKCFRRACPTMNALGQFPPRLAPG